MRDDPAPEMRKCAACGAVKPLTEYYAFFQRGKCYYQTTCKLCRCNAIRTQRETAVCKICNREKAWTRYQFVLNDGKKTRVCRECATEVRVCTECKAAWPLTDEYYESRRDGGWKKTCIKCLDKHRYSASRPEPMGYPICRAEWRRPVEPITFDWWLRHEA